MRRLEKELYDSRKVAVADLVKKQTKILDVRRLPSFAIYHLWRSFSEHRGDHLLPVASGWVEKFDHWLMSEVETPLHVG